VQKVLGKCYRKHIKNTVKDIVSIEANIIHTVSAAEFARGIDRHSTNTRANKEANIHGSSFISLC